MFASMFKLLFNKSGETKIKKNESKQEMVKITKQDVEDLLNSLNEINSNSGRSCSVSEDYDVVEAVECLSIADTCSEDFNIPVDNFNDSKSEVSSFVENKQVSVDPNNKKITNQINSLQCLFTWQLKPNDKRNLIFWVKNKYGDYNLDISSPEFTFERYIGNLIIGYEMFHTNTTELGQIKVLEIGKWLEDLDKENSTEEFYYSIKIGLKHVMSATFIHMLFATNLIEECKWLLDDIVPFANMDPRPRAAVYAVRAAVLTEYGGNFNYKKACECAKKACDLDPSTSHWFYIYSLALTAQRQFLWTHKSSPTENEINAIQQAIMLSDGKNTLYNYHRMTLDRDTIATNFHNNKNKKDKSFNEKNLQENKTIVQMIKTIISMEPKDPHVVVKCARTLLTLPVMVRDFDLGKKYLTKALQMAPNDLTVLKAVTRAVEVHKELSKKSRYTTFQTKQNQPPLMDKTANLKDDLRQIRQIHINGEDPVPHLTNLVAKYNGFHKCKIVAQICSYNLLFTRNLKNAIDQFIWLIEQPDVVNNDLITLHFSTFGSKKFNLAELICNEIRLATNSSGTSSEDMLYYFKILTKIMETCNLKMKDVDPSMKDKLLKRSICDLSAGSACSNATYKDETDFSDNDSVINKKENLTQKQENKNCKPKHLRNSGTRVLVANTSTIFTKQPKTNKEALTNKTNNPPKRDIKKKNAPKNVQNKTHQANASSMDQMKLKMSKFLNLSPLNGHESSNNSNPSIPDNLRNIKTQAEIEQYTQLLYQNILNNTQQQYNLHNVNTQSINRFFNQSPENLNPPLQQSPVQNPHPLPSLLSLRPQISPQNEQPDWQRPKKLPFKKK